MTRALRLEVDAPDGLRALEQVIALRLEAPDGALGVLPGHERAVLALLPGPLVARRASGEEVFVATEGGLAWVEPALVRVVTSWAAQASSLPRLQRLSERRARLRRLTEDRLRTRLAAHDAALRRVLAGLEREVAR